MGLKEFFLLRVAKRWISIDLDAAIADAKRANDKGFGVLVNFLGEEIKDPATADSQVKEYLKLQEAVSANGIKGCASVKLTQFGLGSDERAAAERLERVASNAERLNQPLWVDMESHAVTDATLRLYMDLLTRHKRTGVALQSYMRRSEADLKMLLDKGAWVRLVKGAYREPHDIILPNREEIDKNYGKELAMLFERGEHFAVATHDDKLVDQAKKLAESKHVDFEFEMLKGIRNELKEELAKSGYKVSEYIPYGDRWFAYSRRRMTEHPSNIWLLLRSLV